MNNTPVEVIIPSGEALLAVRIYNRSATETMILLHGGPGVPDEMTEVRELLSEWMQVVSFDQRGTGALKCPACKYTMEEYINDISNLGAFLNLEHFHLFGHSWGGLYAQLFADVHPENVRSLFLCSPASGTGEKIWDLTEKEVMQYIRKKSTTATWIKTGLLSLCGMMGSSKAYRKLYRCVIQKYNQGFAVPSPDWEKLNKINARPVNKTRRNIRKHHPLKTFGNTSYPVMITYGQFDVYAKSREFVKMRFPYARYEIIPDCGHTPWKHNLPAFENILKDFYKADGRGNIN
jgi:proline iminopeptidase